MKIEFFETPEGLDQRAVGAGVYSISLRQEGMQEGESVFLYIGESVWMARRCAEHLYAVFEEPEYFGLTKQDIREDSKLILRFAVKETVESLKGALVEKEKACIKELKPLTQGEESDRQLRIPVKLERVQGKIKQWSNEAK